MILNLLWFIAIFSGIIELTLALWWMNEREHERRGAKRALLLASKHMRILDGRERWYG